MILFSLLILLIALGLLCITLWNVISWAPVGDHSERGLASVSVLVPARDEEENIAACIETVLAQEDVCEILVYDDYSNDATARLVSEYSRRDQRVRLVVPKPLPPGWCGKTFACAQLASAARGSWLLFLDADARLRPRAVTRMLGTAQTQEVTLLSCWPRLDMRGFWEGLLMPLLNFVVFTLYPAPLAARRRQDPSLGLAHGSCLLARSDSYKLVGGHGAVRDQLFEDVRLAQVWRLQGQQSLCLDGQSVVAVRMYHSLAQIWQGFQKNFYPAFRRDRTFWLFMSVHLLVFLLPFLFGPLVFVFFDVWVLAVAAACVVAMRAALSARFSHPWWSVMLHPLGEVFLVALGCTSWWKCKTGHGVEWKGRRYGDRATTSDGCHRV